MKLTEETARSRVGLTPMIDVVFLLLVFFMLAARFGAEGAIGLTAAGQQTAGAEVPRVIDVFPDEIALNGVQIHPDKLLSALSEVPSDNVSLIVLRPRDGSDVQRLIDLAETLKLAGYENLVLVE